MLEDVEGGAGDRPLGQRGDERLLVHDRAAARVHEHGRRLHPGQRGGVDQMPRLVGQRQVQRDDVGGREQLVERQAAAARGVDDVHSVRQSQSLDRLPDPAVTDEAEGEPGEPSAEHQVRRPDPALAAADQAVALGDAAEQREHQRDGELGRRLGQDVGCVRDHDPAPPARVQVDVVDPDRVVRDDAQLRPGRVEQLVVDAVGEHQHQPVLAGHAPEELLALGGPLGVVQVELERALELLPHAIGEAPRGEHARHLPLENLGVRLVRRVVLPEDVARPLARLPGGHRCLALLVRDEARALHELVLVDVARAVREDLGRLGTRTTNWASGYSASSGSSSATDAMPFSRIRRRRSKSMKSSPTCGLTSALPGGQVHAVPVVDREGDRPLVEHAHEAGLAALVRALRAAVGVRRGDEEHVAPLDERAVVLVDHRVDDALLDPVGEAARVEAVLQPAIAFVVDGHGGILRAGLPGGGELDA